MAQIISCSIDVTKIDKSKLVQGKKGTYLPLTIVLNNEPDKYGNDVSVSLAQTKEEREAKTPKVYLGNGKTVWKGQSVAKAAPSNDDIPF
jgi:hypothetical protein